MSLTDKEAAIKAAKEVIGKDGILKAIEEGDIEASGLVRWFIGRRQRSGDTGRSDEPRRFLNPRPLTCCSGQEAVEENSNVKTWAIN